MLIRAQSGREVEGEETSLRVPSLPPVAAPSAKVNVVLTSRAQFQEVKKKKTTEKKRGWSPLLKLKFHLGKQTGFPPVVTHPRHPCHLFPACHFSPLCF